MNSFKSLSKKMIFLYFFVATQITAWSQVSDLTIEKIKIEAQLQAERGKYPMPGIDPPDAAQAFSLIQTRDRDEWANGWSLVAQKYLDQARNSSSPASASL